MIMKLVKKIISILAKKKCRIRRLGRDVKAVHTDVHKLLKTGILEKTESGKIEFPYDEIHVDFVVKSVNSA